MDFCRVFDAPNGSTSGCFHGLTAFLSGFVTKSARYYVGSQKLMISMNSCKDSHQTPLLTRYVEHNGLGYGCDL